MHGVVLALHAGDDLAPELAAVAPAAAEQGTEFREEKDHDEQATSGLSEHERARRSLRAGRGSQGTLPRFRSRPLPGESAAAFTRRYLGESRDV